jgi:REP-associated tyrosine transposase
VGGGVYHVYARGNDRRKIFRDDRDRRLYIRILEYVVEAKRWTCVAYCLMGNHVHLLLETPHANLDAGMQLLHGLYAQRHNARHERSGHLFQGRYGASLLLSSAQVATSLEYIRQNPVEANLCNRPEDWPWLHPKAAEEEVTMGAAGFEPATSRV